MITKAVIELVKQLSSTHSPTEWQKYILIFCQKEGKDNDQSEIDDLLNYYQSLVDKKRSEGQKAILNRITKSNKGKRTYARPRFFIDHNTKPNDICYTCKEKIDSKTVFKHKVNGIYVLYHCFPACFPKEHMEVMLTDKYYLAWKKGN